MDKDTEKGQETQEVKEKTYSEAEHKGVISDLQKERQQRQQFGFDLSQTQSRVSALEKENEELKRKSEEAEIKKSVIVGDDEDVLTKKDGRDIESKVMDHIKKAQDIVKAKNEKERLDINFKKSCTLARDRYAERKDIGLDWEPVYQAALKRLAGRQYRELDIYHSDDPGEELYQEGLKDPEIKEKLELAKNEKILDAMGTRKVDKKSLTGDTKVLGFTYYTPEQVEAMKPEEAQKVLKDIEKSMEKW